MRLNSFTFYHFTLFSRKIKIKIKDINQNLQYIAVQE